MIHICDHKLLIFNLLLIMSVWACEMKEILTFTAYEGGKAEIRCPYESGYETYNKYLCRGECPFLNKDILVESGSAAKDRRFSLTDDTTTHIFTVTITDLRTDDEGQYWCAVRTRFLKTDLFTEIHLEIKPVSVVSAVTGEHLNITCYYESDVKNDVKFLCKGSDLSLCETSAIKVSSERKSNGRFSLRDDESARVFTVNITDLTQEDSGIYWCGAGERGKNKWISAIDLNISGVPSERKSSKPTSTASDHSTEAASEDGGSLPLPPSSSSSVTSLSSQLQLAIIFMLPVMGILMVFGLSLFIYFQVRQKKEGVQWSGVTHVSAENLLTEDATYTICHYEEIICSDNRPGFSLGLPVFGEHDASDTLYSTVLFQTTDHSDRTSAGQDC